LTQPLRASPTRQAIERMFVSVNRESLEAAIDLGLNQAEMASRFGVSVHTIRRRLLDWGLQTNAERRRRRRREAKRAGHTIIRRDCPHHGESDFFLEGRGYYRCLRCRQDAVARRRRKVKAILVAESGGRCALCGYNRHVRALHFHHTDPREKRFQLSFAGQTRSLAAMRAEAKKCVLLCSNCHAEVEAGLVSVLSDHRRLDPEGQVVRSQANGPG